MGKITGLAITILTTTALVIVGLAVLLRVPMVKDYVKKAIGLEVI